MFNGKDVITGKASCNNDDHDNDDDCNDDCNDSNITTSNVEESGCSISTSSSVSSTSITLLSSYMDNTCVDLEMMSHNNKDVVSSLRLSEQTKSCSELMIGNNEEPHPDLNAHVREDAGNEDSLSGTGITIKGNNDSGGLLEKPMPDNNRCTNPERRIMQKTRGSGFRRLPLVEEEYDKDPGRENKELATYLGIWCRQCI